MTHGERACERCKATTMHALTRNRTLNGAAQVGLRCEACDGWTKDRRGRLWIPVAELEAAGIAVDELPIATGPGPDVRCQRCHARGAEQHHWAPRALFGDRADSWPKDWLCKPCHDEWHQIVTPQLVRQA